MKINICSITNTGWSDTVVSVNVKSKPTQEQIEKIGLELEDIRERIIDGDLSSDEDVECECFDILAKHLELCEEDVFTFYI